jgi:hypothetical protein
MGKFLLHLSFPGTNLQLDLGAMRSEKRKNKPIAQEQNH